MSFAISQYAFGRETIYYTFPLTEAGLKEAREYLETKLAKGHTRSVSPWQFDGSHSSAMHATNLIYSGDVAGLRDLIAKDAPQV